jgi:hypothetical protein
MGLGGKKRFKQIFQKCLWPGHELMLNLATEALGSTISWVGSGAWGQKILQENLHKCL